MIFISDENAADLWERAVVELYRVGLPLPENKFFRNESAALEVRNTGPSGAMHSKHSPLSVEAIKAVCDFFLNGRNAGESHHEWTRIYRERLFGPPNQIERIVGILREWPDCPRAQISVWDPDRDYVRSNLAPCLQLLWFKLIQGDLHLHVHMRTSDCYGKLLLNLNEFMELQRLVASQLDAKSGTYVQFVDSLHFHSQDADAAEELAIELANSRGA